jgi:hypothetical protein
VINRLTTQSQSEVDPSVRQPETFLRCCRAILSKVLPRYFEIGSEGVQPGGWATGLLLEASILIRLSVVVHEGHVGVSEHFPLSELAREAGEARAVGEANRPHIYRCSW